MSEQATQPMIAPAIAMPSLDLEALISFRRDCVRDRKFAPLGLLEKVMLEKSAVAVTTGNPLAQRKDMSASIQFMKQGPLLGLSPDGQDILVCTPMKPPPNLPDPSWVPKPIYYKQGTRAGFLKPQKPRMIKQLLEHRATCVLKGKDGTEWIVFQPVHQLLILRQDRTGMDIVQCGADRTGKHTALLYNPETLEAHFLFGMLRIDEFSI